MIGQINTPVRIEATGTVIQWSIDDPTINLRIALDSKSASFTPSQNKTYKVTVVEDGKPRVVEVIVGGTTPTPTPTPTPIPAGNVLYDSRVNSKLHDGKVRTITQEGIITAGGLGVECRASGNPKIVVNADGTFSLVTGTGKIDNLSLRLRSRHNEGGDCSNRFGGFGASIHDSTIEFKTESCHNEHENSSSKSHSINIRDGKFHKSVFEVKDSGSEVVFSCSLDTVTATGKHSSPQAFYLDKATFDKNSYIWLRANNSDNGRIYIYVKNYNARLEVEYRFDSGNSITFNSVKVIAI